MIRLILFGIFFVILTNKQQLDAVREFYSQTPDSFRPINLNQFKSGINADKVYTQRQQYRYGRSREISPTFRQSRHFHPDQLARDNRDLSQPSSFTAQISSSYYSYGGAGTNIGSSTLESCHLTDNMCSFDYQCCSGKCRCVRWSITGQVSCLKKCF